MRQSLQSFTPVVRPLNYDSLATREGCEPESGNTFFGALPFAQLCVFEHDGGIQWFAQPDTVSYTLGPRNEFSGVPKPYHTQWAAWVSNTGIRYGKLGYVIPPADGLGAENPLFPTTKPSKVAIGFDNNGFQSIAIHKSENFIALKRYVTAGGALSYLEFPGKQPVFFNTSSVEAAGAGDLVLYYLKEERPFLIFARFKQEDFGIEHVIMPDLRVALVRLIGSRSLNGKHVLYAIDDLGRDVTLGTLTYSLKLSDKGTISTEFNDGIIAQIVIESEETSSKSKVGFIFLSGSLVDGTAEAKAIPVEKCTLKIKVEGGELTLP